MPETRPLSTNSQETHKLLDAQPRRPDDRTKGAAVKLLVIGNYDLGKGIVAAQNDVAAGLSSWIESCFLERGYARSSRDVW